MENNKNGVVKKNASEHLAPGRRGWHAVPGVLNKEHFMGTPSSPLWGTSPAGGEVNGGFTLIELLVVVLIIGILAAVAVPQYQVAVRKSRYATLMHNVKALADAAEIAYLEHGSYPDSLENLDISNIQGCSRSGNAITCANTMYIYGGGSVYRNNMHLERIEGFLKKDGAKGLAYLQYLKHSQANAGALHCSVYFDNTAVSQQVCKSFGGEQADSVTWTLH